MSASVLIPTGRKMKSYGCMRSLNRRGVHTIVASEYDRIPHFSSKFCSESVHLSTPPEDVTEYKDDLLEIARRPDVETVLPVRECDAYLLAKYGEEFEEHVSLVTPRLEVLRRGHDRLRLAESAAEAGVPVARTRLLSEVSEWDTDAVVKSRYNLLTPDYVDGYPADTVEEMKKVEFLEAGERPDVDALRAEMKHDPIVQEFIPQEKKHLSCALWDHGEPLATYQHEQIRQNSWVGGGGVYRTSVQCREVEETAHDLLSELEWHGFACIEYVKHAETGEWTFLEINPRVWQSQTEAVRANADFPYYYWLAAMGEEDRIDPSYDAGVSTHIAYGEVAHLMSVLNDESPFLDRPSFLGTLGDIGLSVLVNPRFDYIRLDDPRFFLSALRETFSTGVTASREYSNGHPEVERPIATVEDQTSD